MFVSSHLLKDFFIGVFASGVKCKTLFGPLKYSHVVMTCICQRGEDPCSSSNIHIFVKLSKGWGYTICKFILKYEHAVMGNKSPEDYLWWPYENPGDVFFVKIRQGLYMKYSQSPWNLQNAFKQHYSKLYQVLFSDWPSCLN